jgi:osmotically inducible protein OsmC
MPKSAATAIWTEGLKNGKGHYSAASGAFQGEYTFATRFEGAKGTTPEELIAAAHASCFSMALASTLEKGGNPPKQIETTATCTLEFVSEKPTITTIRLETRGKVSGIDESAFKKAAEEAKNGCPVSRALKNNVKFQLAASLQS